jgi:hypothetical protein
MQRAPLDDRRAAHWVPMSHPRAILSRHSRRAAPQSQSQTEPKVHRVGSEASKRARKTKRGRSAGVKPTPQLQMLDEAPEYFDMRLPNGSTQRERIVRRLELHGVNEFVMHFSHDEWRVSHASTGCLVAVGKTNIEVIRKANERAKKAIDRNGTMERWIEATRTMVVNLQAEQPI